MTFYFKDVYLSCYSLSTKPALFVLLAMAIYTGVTVNFLGKRFGDWRFSWSYILGWVALLMTFFAGLYTAFRNLEDRHNIPNIEQLGLGEKKIS